MCIAAGFKIENTYAFAGTLDVIYTYLVSSKIHDASFCNRIVRKTGNVIGLHTIVGK